MGTTLAASTVRPNLASYRNSIGESEEPGSVDWTRQFGTTGASTDIAQSVAIDGAGNAYVVGQVFATLPGQPNSGGADAFVRKYDGSGNLVWTRQFGTSGNDFAAAVLVSGNAVYVGGGVRGALPGFSFAGVDDAYLMKYDTNGNLVWTDQFGSAAGEQVMGIAGDASVFPTVIYVIGPTNDALPDQTWAGGTDAYVRKYSDNGSTTSVPWTRQFGTAAADASKGLALDATGIYVAGRTDADLDGAFPETFKGSTDAFVRKYDASGNVVWTRQFGTSLVDIAFNIAADASSVYVVGRTDADLDGTGPETFKGNKDTFVQKYDASGNVIWTRQVGTSSVDVALAVSVDAAGVHLAGRTDGDLDGAGSGTFAGVSDAFVQTYDTNGTLLWTREFGSPAFDQALGIVGDGSAVFVAGQVDGALPGETSEGGGNTDAFVQKYDAGGNVSWTQRFGTLGPEADLARAVAMDEDRNVYVAGDTRGTLPGQTSVGLNDAFLRKYDRDGNLLWTRQFGSVLTDFGLAVAVDADRQRVYVAGRSDTAQLGQSFAGGQSDAYVRAFDLNGNDVWTRQFGTNDFDNLSAVTVDERGAVYVAGQTNGTLLGQPPVGGVNDAFIRKYDSDGNEVWTRQFGSANSDSANGISVDGKGDVYVVGQTMGTLPGQPPLAGVADAFIRKYDDDGKELWTRQFGSSLADSANAVSAGPKEVYVVGSVGAALPGQSYFGGGTDAFIRKYDRNGKEVWTRQFGTPLGAPIGDKARAVFADATGRVYVAGDVGGTFPGQTSAGSTDAYVRKYDRDGNEVWTIQLGSSQRDSIGGVVAHASGEVVVAGNTDGALPGQTSTGDVDGFVMKIVSAPSN
jgi:hypothetical protein